MSYFSVMPENPPGCWRVADIHTITSKRVHPNEFTSGKRWVADMDLILEVKHGFPWDIGPSLWGPIIAKEKIGSLLLNHFANDLQLIPVDTPMEFNDKFVIVNILNCIDCFDEKRTELWETYSMKDGPELAGQYKYAGMKIIESRVEEKDLFWVARTCALVVSEKVKSLLKGKRGIDYWPV